MNSLVVFLSVVALVAGKPSGLLSSPILSYSTPIVASPALYSAPAAVSSQSRLDIKSSPAVVTTAEIAPISRTVIAEPGLIASPAIATAAIAPAAVSSQSRIDIKSTPAITSTLVSSPIAYSAPIAYDASYAYNAPILAGAVAPAYLKTAFAAPGFIKGAELAHPIAGPAAPLDTPEVIAARAAHFEAKALAGAHLIKKRSATLYGSPLLSSPVISTYGHHLAYSAPIAYSTPLITKAYSVHPW